MRALDKDMSFNSDYTDDYFKDDNEATLKTAIEYCIETYDSRTATNRIVQYIKDSLELKDQMIIYKQNAISYDI